jgi:hypothetical protein
MAFANCDSLQPFIAFSPAGAWLVRCGQRAEIYMGVSSLNGTKAVVNVVITSGKQQFVQCTKRKECVAPHRAQCESVAGHFAHKL